MDLPCTTCHVVAVSGCRPKPQTGQWQCNVCMRACLRVFWRRTCRSCHLLPSLHHHSTRILDTVSDKRPSNKSPGSCLIAGHTLTQHPQASCPDSQLDVQIIDGPVLIPMKAEKCMPAQREPAPILPWARSAKSCESFCTMVFESVGDHSLD